MKKETLQYFFLGLLISFFYLITWIIIWQKTKAKKKALNDKLKEYKQIRKEKQT